MVAPAKLTFLPDVVEEHYHEVQFLWTQRRAALRSSAYTAREFAQLEERIEAHSQGMAVAGDRVLDIVGPGLAGDEELPAFAAAVALLCLGTPGALARVADAFETARGGKVDGLREALASRPTREVGARLSSCFLSGPPTVAAAAAEVLVFHGAMNLDAPTLERFLQAEDPAVRASAWRLASYCGVSVSADRYDAGLGDDDPRVQRAAREAAVWAKAPAFAIGCRGLAARPTPAAVDALTLFACGARPEDYQLIGAIATNPAAGPDRFRVIGSFAHPYFIDLLIQEMSNPDPAAAVAAGAAFFKMTGRDVESNTRVKVSPDGEPPADDFEAEFMDEVFLPDPDLARKHWQELAPTLARSPRICRGMDVSRPLSREQFALLDMESRYEYCLHMRLFGGWQGTPLVLERYPQRF